MSEESIRVLPRWVEGGRSDRRCSAIDESLDDDSYCDADRDRIAGIEDVDDAVLVH